MYIERRTRYPGIKPFTTDEQPLFFGRDADREALFKLVFVQPLVVLYGRSGYGKSSLLNAGLVPRLIEAGLPHFTIRFGNHNPDDASRQHTPTQTVAEQLTVTPMERSAWLRPFEALTPPENALWYRLKTHQVESGQEQLVLIFDQFEELFSYPAGHVADFKRQLADLLYGTVPDAVLEHEEVIAQLPETEQGLFFQKPDIRLLFAIRADRLALLNGLKDLHPSILRHCYELDALDETEARAAIVQPALIPAEAGGYETPPYTYEPALLDQIIQKIRTPDGKIEAANLQIVCGHLEKCIVPEKAGREEIILKVSDLDHIEGGLEGIFNEFYERVLALLTPVEQKIAQGVIEEEFVKDNQRMPFALEYLLSRFADEGLTEDLLNRLADASLLRVERDSQGRMIYELAHDALIRPVVEAPKRRRERARRAEETERVRQTELSASEVKAPAPRSRRTVVYQSLRVAAALGAIVLVFLGLTDRYFSRSQGDDTRASLPPNDPSLVANLETISAENVALARRADSLDVRLASQTAENQALRTNWVLLRSQVAMPGNGGGGGGADNQVLYARIDSLNVQLAQQRQLNVQLARQLQQTPTKY